MIKKYILLSTLVTGFTNATAWSFKTDVRFEPSDRFLSTTAPIDGSSVLLSYLQDGKEIHRDIIVELLSANKETVDLKVKIQDRDGKLISSTQFLNAAICQENQAKHEKYEMRFIPFNNDLCKQYFDIKPMKLGPSDITSVSLHIPESKTKNDWNVINFTYIVIIGNVADFFNFSYDSVIK